MKRFLFLFILFAVQTAEADNSMMNRYLSYDGINYVCINVANIEGDWLEVRITQSPNVKGDIIIPGTFVYKKKQYSPAYDCFVCAISSEAFSNCTELTSISLPSSPSPYITIGSKAFSGCTGLKSIDLGNFVSSIGERAFQNCIGLTSVLIPSSVKYIGDYAFEGCTGLPVENNIRYSGKDVIAVEDKTLSEYIIKEGTEHISNCAFSRCTNMKSIIIPNSVTTIGAYAFSDCTELTSITIPNSVTRIEENAFSNCPNLHTIKLANEAIYSIAGIFGKQVKECVLLGGVKTIEESAFSGCTELTSITIPNSVTSIGGGAFSGCTGLTSITIPNLVTSIGGGAFQDCTGLTSITIPNSVTGIGECAFSGCTGLTSVTIPNSVTGIGECAFSGCTGLTSITIPYSVTSIGGGAFQNCTGLTSITIPNSVTDIGERAFSGCTGLTSVTIPNSVTSIGYCALYGCTGLTSVTIPNSVTSIGRSAFRSCTGLTSVTIGSSVTEMGNYAFSGCTGLKTLYYFATRPFKIKSECFSYETYENATLVVLKGYMPTVSTLDYWSKFKNIVEQEELPDEVQKGNLLYSIIGNIATVIGVDKKNVTGVTIPEEITIDGITYTINSIGDEAFSGCVALTFVYIPSSVTSIGNKAFANCNKLSRIFCSSLTPPAIDGQAFSETTLQNATLYVPKRSMYDYASTWGIHKTKEYSAYEKVEDILHDSDSTTEEDCVVYDMSGNRMVVKKSALLSLPHGIYVVNGKKYKF